MSFWTLMYLLFKYWGTNGHANCWREGWESVPSQQPFQILPQAAFWLLQLFIMYTKISGRNASQFLYCSKWMIWHSIPKGIKIKVLVCNLFVHYGDKKESQSASLPVRGAGMACWHTQPILNTYLTSHNKQQALQHAERFNLFRLFWTNWRHQSEGTYFL